MARGAQGRGVGLAGDPDFERLFHAQLVGVRSERLGARRAQRLHVNHLGARVLAGQLGVHEAPTSSATADASIRMMTDLNAG